LKASNQTDSILKKLADCDIPCPVSLYLDTGDVCSGIIVSFDYWKDITNDNISGVSDDIRAIAGFIDDSDRDGYIHLYGVVIIKDGRQTDLNSHTGWRFKLSSVIGFSFGLSSVSTAKTT